MTPLTKNFLSPSKKNFAAVRIREFVASVMSSGVETSLNVFALDGKTSPAFAQSYSRASDFRRPLLFVRQSCQFPYKTANASRTTSPVRSMSPAVCAVEMNPVSNCDGAK